MNTRREFLKMSLSAIPALALARTEAAQTMGQRPNIIYFVCHDLGQMISPYGIHVDTPNLQAFADSGATLMNAYCSSPACVPSRASAMSGRYAHKTGVMGTNDGGIGKDASGKQQYWRLQADQKSIVHYLNEAGYMTVHCGTQAERHIEGPLSDKEPNPGGYQVDFGKGWPSCFVENAVDDAVKWMKNRDPKETRPFYLNIGTQEAHMSVWDGPLGKKFGRPQVYGGPDPEDKVWIPPNFPDNKMTRKELAAFWPCVRFMDREFGRLIREIDALGYGKNTIVVFTTDHGMTGPRHKGRIYDSGTGIATLIRYPGKIPAGVRPEVLITNVDFCPTFLDAAGAPIPSIVDGRSFWPLLAGGKYTPNECVFTQRNYHGNYDPMRAVRTKDFLYVRNFHKNARYAYTAPETLAMPVPKCDQWPGHEIESARPFDDPFYKDWPLRAREELYDLRKDPLQYHNVANQPEYAAVLKALVGKLECWMKDNNDVLLQGVVAHGNGALS